MMSPSGEDTCSDHISEEEENPMPKEVKFALPPSPDTACRHSKNNRWKCEHVDCGLDNSTSAVVVKVEGAENNCDDRGNNVHFGVVAESVNDVEMATAMCEPSQHYQCTVYSSDVSFAADKQQNTEPTGSDDDACTQNDTASIEDDESITDSQLAESCTVLPAHRCKVCQRTFYKNSALKTHHLISHSARANAKHRSIAVARKSTTRNASLMKTPDPLISTTNSDISQGTVTTLSHMESTSAPKPQRSVEIIGKKQAKKKTLISPPDALAFAESPDPASLLTKKQRTSRVYNKLAKKKPRKQQQVSTAISGSMSYTDSTSTFPNNHKTATSSCSTKSSPGNKPNNKQPAKKTAKKPNANNSKAAKNVNMSKSAVKNGDTVKKDSLTSNHMQTYGPDKVTNESNRTKFKEAFTVTPCSIPLTEGPLSGPGQSSTVVTIKADLDSLPNVEHPISKRTKRPGNKQVRKGKKRNVYAPIPASELITNMADVVVKVGEGNIGNQCSICLRTFAHTGALRMHLRQIHTQIINPPVVDAVMIARINAKRRRPISDDEKNFECSICYKKFKVIHGLERHQMIHSTEKPFHCQYCEYRGVSAAYLAGHMRTHTGDRPYKCKICNKKFSQSSNLRNHQFIHTGERPYECAQCGKRFAHLTGVKVHMRTHTGEKPYQCPTCGRHFMYASDLHRHKFSHSGEKPYTCNLCDMKFARKPFLQKHLLTHANIRRHRCKICGNKFTSAANRDRHMMSHTGEKPFKCANCDYKSSHKHHVIRHQAVHNKWLKSLPS